MKKLGGWDPEIGKPYNAWSVSFFSTQKFLKNNVELGFQCILSFNRGTKSGANLDLSDEKEVKMKRNCL